MADTPQLVSEVKSGTELLAWLEGLELRERYAQRDNRAAMANDEDIYDTIQWDAEEKWEVESRGQPALSYNEVKPMVQWILGTEKRSRADWKILPRAKDDVEPALRKTKLFKYVSDINKAEYQRSQAFTDTVKTGLGWIKVSAEYDDYGNIKLVYRHVPWREMWYDSRSRQLDYSDASYVVRSRYADLDECIANFPKFQEQLISASRTDRSTTAGDLVDDVLEDEFTSATSTGGEERRIVLLKEVWYKKNERVRVIRAPGHELHGEVFDKTNPLHGMAVEDGEVETVSVVRRRVYMALYCDNIMLHSQQSPFNHDRFPYVPIWGERYGRTGHPYGAVRPVVDPQMSLNKRMSKALHLLCTSRLIYDSDAFDEEEIDLETELARPDSMLKKKPKSEVRIEGNGEFAAAHMQLAMRDSAYIRQAGGVTGENLGMETNATTGIAIRARQEQGTIVTTTLFDNLRLAMQISGEILLSLIEQFMTDQMEFRITGERGKDEFVTINDGQPENDITRCQSDFIVSEQDYRASVRQAMSEELMRTASALPPEAAMVAIIGALDLSDLPNKDDLVKEMRKVAGIPDPDAPEEEKQAQEDQQAKQQQFQERMSQAELAIKEAKAERDAAAAERDRASIQTQKLDTIMKAFETAGIVTAAGTLAPSVDELIQRLSSLTAEAPAAPAAPVISDQSQLGNAAQPIAP